MIKEKKDLKSIMKQIKTFSRRNFKIPFLRNFWRDFKDALNYQISFEFSNNQLAIVFPSDGTKFWYQNDKPHRTDGPAIEWANGHKYWFQNGELHRTDGPAIEEVDGTKEWFQNGKRHRTDGPAIEYANGDKYWYLEGKRCSELDLAS